MRFKFIYHIFAWIFYGKPMNLKNDFIPKPDAIKKFIKSGCFMKSLLGIVAGASAGYLYYRFVGCQSGACAITGSPLGSVIAGGLLGFLIADPRCSKSQI